MSVFIYDTTCIMMQKQCERLRGARMRKGFKKPTDAARAFGWTTSTYISHENGNRGLSGKSAGKYARAFGISAGWLLTGENPPEWLELEEMGVPATPVYQIPKLTIAEIGQLTARTLREHIEKSPEYSMFSFDPTMGANVFELLLEDESMSPKFRAGESVVIDRDSEAKPGDYVLVVSKSQAMLRRLRIGGYDDEGEPKLELVPQNDAWPTQPLTDDDWVVGRMIEHRKKY